MITAIRAQQLIDGRSGQTIEEAVVLLEGNLILAGCATAQVPVSAEAEVHRGQRTRAFLHSFIDAHAQAPSYRAWRIRSSQMMELTTVSSFGSSANTWSDAQFGVSTAPDHFSSLPRRRGARRPLMQEQIPGPG